MIKTVHKYDMQSKHIWYINFVLTILQITEMKVKHLVTTHSIKTLLLHLVDCPCNIRLLSQISKFFTMQ